MKKTTQIFLFLFLLVVTSYGQQDPQFSHYFFLKNFYNPAYSGTNKLINFDFLSHQQWQKFEGAPQTTVFSFDALAFNRLGYGLTMVDDRYGFVRDFRFNIPLSYHFNIKNKDFSIGINPGLFSKKFKGQWLFPDQNESILQSEKNAYIFDIGFGIYYTSPNLYIGLSSSHLTHPKFYFYTDNGDSSGSIFLVSHYYFMSGYTFRTFNTSLEVTPSIFIKSDGNEIQEEINILASYNKNFWFAVTYRNKDALAFFIGTSYFNNMKIGFSYDITLSYLNRVTNGTFEVYAGYSFKFNKAEKNYQSNVKYFNKIN